MSCTQKTDRGIILQSRVPVFKKKRVTTRGYESSHGLGSLRESFMNNSLKLGRVAPHPCRSPRIRDKYETEARSRRHPNCPREGVETSEKV